MDTASRFAELTGPIEDRMFATVWRILRHADDAEDALHAAVTVVWKERLRVERHPNPQALILKICADVAIDHFRHRERRRERQTPDAVAGSMPARGLDPVGDAVARESLDEMMSAIARLSQNQAVAVVMRFVQSESYETIAAALGCGTATARKHVARGREKLARMLRHLDPAALAHDLHHHD